jgi:retron-type reverse transcriptase
MPSGGTPQRAVISPLLANIYLHGLDGQMVQKGYRMVRERTWAQGDASPGRILDRSADC